MMMEDDVTVKLIDFNGARVAGNAGICHTYIGNEITMSMEVKATKIKERL